MDLNHIETTTNYFITNKSVLHCLFEPSYRWNLNETTSRWIIAAVISIASPAIVLLNILVIVVLKQTKELKKRRGNILLSSLAVTDILVGALCMPLTVTVDWLIIEQVSFKHGCTLTFANVQLNLGLSVCSLCNLTMIAWERYVAIRKWKNYKNISTEGRLKTLAVIAWIFGMFFSFSFRITGEFIVNPVVKAIRGWYVTVIVYGALALIICFYTMVYLETRKRRKIVAVNQVTKRQAEVNLEVKVAKTSGLISLALLISFFQSVAVYGLGRVQFPRLHEYSAFRWSEILLHLNSLVNPLIYCYRDPQFRKVVLDFLGIKKSRKAVQPAANVARFARKKKADPFVSSRELSEGLQTEKNRPRLKRSATCNTAHVLDPAAHRRSRKIVLKQSVSAPSLDQEGSSFLVGSPVKQPSSVLLLTTA